MNSQPFKDNKKRQCSGSLQPGKSGKQIWQKKTENHKA